MPTTAQDTAVDGLKLELLKVTVLSKGVRLTERASTVLSQDGQRPLTVHEYATTGGVTLRLPRDVYVNAPFDDWYCDDSPVVIDGGEDDRLDIQFGDLHVEDVRFLPLPGYLQETDVQGRNVTDTAMSHGDRVRISPISGCAYDCSFCDLPSARYMRHPLDQLRQALHVALGDEVLPARHVLISGGSPGRRDLTWFEDVVVDLTRACPVPVDVMMAAVPDTELVDRLVDGGVAGFSLNIELFGEDASSLHIRAKNRLARPCFEDFAGRAVERLGRDGRVRSLIIVGLEPPEYTLAGVELLASLGVHPVLSPFRPARQTRLEEADPPDAGLLLDVLAESRRIVDRYGVSLGPSCVPCQHNVLAFPWDNQASRGVASGLANR